MEAECFKCSQIGHIAPACKAQRKSKLAGNPPGKGTLSQWKPAQDPQGAHQLGVAEESVEYSMFHCQLPWSAAYKTWLWVNGVETEMENRHQCLAVNCEWQELCTTSQRHVTISAAGHQPHSPYLLRGTSETYGGGKGDSEWKGGSAGDVATG